MEDASTKGADHGADPLAGAPEVEFNPPAIVPPLETLPKLVDEHVPIRARIWFFRIVPLVVLGELIADVVVARRVLPDTDFQHAATHVIAQQTSSDCVVAGPDWIEPRVRQAFGNQLSLAAFASADARVCKRLFFVTARGFRLRDLARKDFAQVFGSVPLSQTQFGRVRVEVYAPNVPPPRLHYDFVDHFAEATVTLHESEPPLVCPLTQAGWGGGGLGQGPAFAARRFVCDPNRGWIHMGPTVLDDLQLQPRRCLWQHPQGTAPLRATFPNVPVGRSIRFFAGIHYEHERDRDKADVVFRVRIAGEEVGTMLHHDGDGWKAMEVSVPTRWQNLNADVSIETTSEAPYLRSLCWAGYTFSDSTAEVHDGAR